MKERIRDLPVVNPAAEAVMKVRADHREAEAAVPVEMKVEMVVLRAVETPEVDQKVAVVPVEADLERAVPAVAVDQAEQRLYFPKSYSAIGSGSIPG